MSPVLEAYLENREALKRFLTRYFSRADDVEDAAQEAFLRAFAAEARGDIRSPKAFLFQVAKNVALNEIARKSNSATNFLEDCGASPVLHDDRQVAVDDQLVSRQKLALFAVAVAELPPQCRRVFLMRKFDGLKVKEIAKTLNITVSAVEKHIAAGLVKCADYLMAYGYEPDDFGASPIVKKGARRSERARADKRRDDR